MPEAAKAALAGGDLSLEHRARALAKQEIDVADNAGADRGRTVAAARAHRRRAVGEFHFAHRAQGFRPAGTVHRASLDIDGGDDVVPGADIVRQLFDQIALAAAVPEMMMRVHDWPRGLEDFLLMEREPVFARIGIEPAPGGGGGA